MPRDVPPVHIELQIMLPRQIANEFLVAIRLCPAQFVVEMNDRENNAKLEPQFQKQPQRRDGINSARNGHTYAIPGMQ